MVYSVVQQNIELITAVLRDKKIIMQNLNHLLQLYIAQFNGQPVFSTASLSLFLHKYATADACRHTQLEGMVESKQLEKDRTYIKTKYSDKSQVSCDGRLIQASAGKYTF